MKNYINQNYFGIIITCYSGDFFLTKGLLASIKKFMPNTPICIIQDGNFSLDEMIKTYNIKYIIRKNNIKNIFLRDRCFGSRCSNLIAFFESPFEKFLYLDSDLVLWGNILEKIDIDSADFIHNEPHEPYNPKIYKEQYFDYDKIFNFTEYFNWETCHFFNSGVFIARKGIFEWEEFIELIEIWSKYRELLPTDPQSILNILVFRNKQKGKIKVLEEHLQTVAPVITKKTLETNFVIRTDPIVNKNTILHWAGLKPLLIYKNTVFVEPMLFFRKLNLINTNSFWVISPILFLYCEECFAVSYYKLRKVTLKKIYNKLHFYFFS